MSTGRVLGVAASATEKQASSGGVVVGGSSGRAQASTQAHPLSLQSVTPSRSLSSPSVHAASVDSTAIAPGSAGLRALFGAESE
jgi:hypothetical protein